jgi:hypothetical protein
MNELDTDMMTLSNKQCFLCDRRVAVTKSGDLYKHKNNNKEHCFGSYINADDLRYVVISYFFYGDSYENFPYKSISKDKYEMGKNKLISLFSMVLKFKYHNDFNIDLFTENFDNIIKMIHTGKWISPEEWLFLCGELSAIR